MNVYDEIKSALILSRIPGVGAATFKELLKKYGSPTIALQHFEKAKTNKKTPLDIQKAMAFLEANSEIKMLWPFHKNYPIMLSDITEPHAIGFNF